MTLVCLVLFSASCRVRRAARAPGADAPGVTTLCANAAQVKDGPYTHENNQWGWAKEQAGFEQCLLERSGPSGVERGWTWVWPGSDSSVFAYPEIIFGWKPWTGGRSSDPRFPLRLSAMRELLIHYEVETNATGSYNLAPEVWLTSARGAGAPNPALISAEVMFWVEAAGVAQPAGAIVDRIAVGDTTYELWQKDGAGDNGRGGWRLLSLKTPTVQRSGTIPVAELLRALVQRGLISAEHFVASVEFGNEISGGTGTTWIKKFAVEVSP